VAARSARTAPEARATEATRQRGMSGRHPIVVCRQCGRTGPGRLATSTSRICAATAWPTSASPRCAAASAARSRSSASGTATTVTSATTASRASTSACAGPAVAWAGSRSARPTRRPRSTTAAIDPRSRRATGAGASSRATTPAIRSGRSAWAAPVGARRSSRAWTAASREPRTGASRAARSARHVTAGAATRSACAPAAGSGRRCAASAATGACCAPPSTSSPTPAIPPRSRRC
jgi:hypothetical protein